jgi:nicotinate-nucleotide adenylyltransferase
MRIGLYFGTFNPIHIGHLILANHFACRAALDEVWLVVTPQSPFKQKNKLLDQYLRLDLVHRAIADNPRLRASDIEFKLRPPHYTVNTLVHLQEKHPDFTFSIIMGEDNLVGLPKWKNFDYLLTHHSILVYPRIGQENASLLNHPAVKMVDAPQIEISSSQIRTLLKNGESARYLLPDSIHDYVVMEQFYR